MKCPVDTIDHVGGIDEGGPVDRTYFAAGYYAANSRGMERGLKRVT
jgi:hypothetical protein